MEFNLHVTWQTI